MWECGIDGCGHREADVEELLVHQSTDHDREQCPVCGTVVPDGYFAIRHVFDEHGRAGYVRAYGADADEIRAREEVREAIEAEADLEAVVERLGGDPAEAE